mmetsp:Transcript_49087/g.106313  ORF Transcript_49087/g.106313 Transcript_49087/m.106313 type:complete len:237 (-) Transcript_49087:219-929(-)
MSMRSESGVRRSSLPSWRARCRSSETVSRTKGRCTFTATTSPVSRRVALYTCPSEAAAIGSALISEKSSDGERPRSSLIVFIANVESKEGTLSQSCCSSTIAFGERMSGRIESAWPSLMKKGPSDTITRRSLATCATSASLPDSSFPRAASKATLASQPADVDATCVMRVKTARGRLEKYSDKRSGSYVNGRTSSPSPLAISTTCMVVPATATSSSLIFVPRRACIMAFAFSSCSI